MLHVEVDAFSPKCAKFVRPLAGGAAVDLRATGQRTNNALLSLLKCECKARKVCDTPLARYAACHASVMGVGAYQGQPHCGDQLEALYACAVAAGPGPPSD